MCLCINKEELLIVCLPYCRPFELKRWSWYGEVANDQLIITEKYQRKMLENNMETTIVEEEEMVIGIRRISS